jgi:nitroreductase
MMQGDANGVVVMDESNGLQQQPLAADQVGLLEGLCNTRAIRRYRDQPVPDAALRDMLFAATRAPSGSNRQPFRFLVLRDGDKATHAKALIGGAAREIWSYKSQRDAYNKGSGLDPESPKARMAQTMQGYVDDFETAPCLILPCMIRYREPNPAEGGSIYPAVQNLLLAARGLGYGGVITGFHWPVEAELRALLGIPEEVFISCTVTIGKPQGQHGPVRRRPLAELVYTDQWEQTADWAQDPPGTRHTRAGPPPPKPG